VITTDCAGNGEIVKDRKTGLLVPPDDREALSFALRWALEHSEDMRKMARQGRRWVEEHCSLKAQGAALEAVYAKALDG
jgi:glycosyltransferase involved in cell wall biosynthesis